MDGAARPFLFLIDRQGIFGYICMIASGAKPSSFDIERRPFRTSVSPRRANCLPIVALQ